MDYTITHKYQLFCIFGGLKKLGHSKFKCITMAKSKELSFQYKEFERIEDLPLELKDLAKKAKEALTTSYSPYSEFAVGAAVLLDNSEIVLGSNQENGAYPSGLCAERVALFYASSQFPGVEVKAMAVAASFKGTPIAEPVSPCGACRQVMIETQNLGGRPYTIVMVGEKRIIVLDDAKFLLPFTFSSVKEATK
jgi:cytidine deaminase